MTIISAFEAKTRFGDLLERVSRGEEFVITKHDKPVARLIPEGRPALSEVRDAVNELASLRKEMAQGRGARPISDKVIRDAIQKGRRCVL
jgi:prevent-host-death family protein